MRDVKLGVDGTAPAIRSGSHGRCRTLRPPLFSGSRQGRRAAKSAARFQVVCRGSGEGERGREGEGACPRWRATRCRRRRGVLAPRGAPGAVATSRPRAVIIAGSGTWASSMPSCNREVVVGDHRAMVPAPGDRLGEVEAARPTLRERTGARNLVETAYGVLGARQREENRLVSREVIYVELARTFSAVKPLNIHKVADKVCCSDTLSDIAVISCGRETGAAGGRPDWCNLGLGVRRRVESAARQIDRWAGTD